VIKQSVSLKEIGGDPTTHVASRFHQRGKVGRLISQKYDRDGKPARVKSVRLAAISRGEHRLCTRLGDGALGAIRLRAIRDDQRYAQDTNYHKKFMSVQGQPN